jgi:murein DD-endopeptidase MepM/ murein hydrolase activator NlpD
VIAATVAFGSALGGRAVAQLTPGPTPTETPSPPTDTPAPTDSPPPSPTETSPTPDPSPTDTSPTPDPSPTDTSPTPTPTPTLSPTTSPTPTPTPTDAPLSSPRLSPSGKPGESPLRAAERGPEAIDARSKHERALARQAETSTPIGGTYSTAALDDVYDKLVKSGMSRDVATRRVYRPFIVRGPAAWTETWHAPRYAGGFHLHDGQDVFCPDGAPVLAATAGRVEFDVDTLGGRIARLFLPDGGYWYYAHLSDWNSTVDSGSRVDVGDVIGYCGNSGDAVGGPTHVHFGHYLPSGQAVDPMADLVDWLEAAERRVGVSERAAEMARSTTIFVPRYVYEVGAAPTVTATSPVVTASLSAARRSAAPSATDVLALAVALAARLLLIPGRRVGRRLGSLLDRGTG